MKLLPVYVGNYNKNGAFYDMKLKMVSCTINKMPKDHFFKGRVGMSKILREKAKWSLEFDVFHFRSIFYSTQNKVLIYTYEYPPNILCRKILNYMQIQLSKNSV